VPYMMTLLGEVLHRFPWWRYRTASESSHCRVNARTVSV